MNSQIYKNMKFSYSDFEKNAHKATEFINTTIRIREENNTLIDDYSIKNAQDWSKLANQIVGAEDFS